MFYRFEIDRNWVLSPTARRAYLVSAILTFTLFASLMGMSIALTAAEGSWSDVPRILAFFLLNLLRISALGAALLWVAMLYYCYGYDHRSEGWRALSFAAFVVFGPLASLVYYFAVYRSHDRREGSVLPTASNTPVLPA